MFAFILGLSFVLTLFWVSAGGYPSEEFGKKGQTERGSCQSRQSLQGESGCFTFEQVELRDWMQSMTEEAVKLRSDLRHTMTALARAEGGEEKA